MQNGKDIDLSQILIEGSGVYLFGEQRIFRSRYVATIERVKESTLHLRLDPEDLREARVKERDKVWLGFAVASRRMYYGAPVQILEIEETEGLVIVSYPDTTKKWPRRNYVRGPVTVPCELELVALDATEPVKLSGKTVNVSASGALVDLEAPPACGDLRGATGTLSLAFPRRPPLRCECMVARLIPNKETPDRPASLAVKYTRIAEVDEMQIQLLVLRATARRFLRAEVSLPCRAEVSPGQPSGRWYSAVSENMSGAGVLLQFEQEVPIEAGERINLEVGLPDRHVLLAGAEVVRVNQEGGRTRIGVDFSHVGEVDRQCIVRFVVAQIRGAPGSVSLDGKAAPADAKPRGGRPPGV